MLRWRNVWKLHLPAVIWGFCVQYFLWTCPLTTWENYFRELGGEAGYEGGFIDYFLVSTLYPNVNPEIHTILAILIILINFGIYFCIFRQKTS